MTAGIVTTGTLLIGSLVSGARPSGMLVAAAGRLTPDEARRLLERELDGRAYDAAEPTWWDRLSRSFIDWLGSIRIGGGSGVGQGLLVVGVVVVLAVVVLVVLKYGLPHRRVHQQAPDGSVFDADDRRDAAALRTDAESAARRGDWDLAVTEAFRALARGLAERDLVPDVPGSTARTIATTAAMPFPDAAEALRDAADRFDLVRYVGASAVEDDFRAVAAVDRSVRATRPADRSGVPA